MARLLASMLLSLQLVIPPLHSICLRQHSDWLPTEQAKGLETRIKKKGGFGLLGISKNLIDEVWGAARPERPNNKLIVLDQRYAGKPFAEKLETLRKEIEKKKSPGFVVSMLDEIAWLYNLRGSEYVTPACFLSLVVPIVCFQDSHDQNNTFIY